MKPIRIVVLTAFLCTACAPAEPMMEPVEVVTDAGTAAEDTEMAETGDDTPETETETPAGQGSALLPYVFTGLPEGYTEDTWTYFSDTEYAIVYQNDTGGTISCSVYDGEARLLEAEAFYWDTPETMDLLAEGGDIANLTKTVRETRWGTMLQYTYDGFQPGLTDTWLTWEDGESWVHYFEAWYEDGTLRNGQLFCWDGERAVSIQWSGGACSIEELLAITVCETGTLDPCGMGPPSAPVDFVPAVVFTGLPEGFGEGELEYYSDTEYLLSYGNGTGGVISCQLFADAESLRTYAGEQLDSWETLSVNERITNLTRKTAETDGGTCEWFTYDTARYTGLRSYRLSWAGTEEWFVLCERRLPDGTLQSGQLCRWDGKHGWVVFWFGEERSFEEILGISAIDV